MKWIIIPILFCICSLMSCKKQVINPKPLVALNLINAINTPQPLFFNNYDDQIWPVDCGRYSIESGISRIYVYPVGDSLHPYYNQNVDAKAGEIYSLFVFGQTPNIESIWLKEAPPVHTTEEASVRVLNLSPDSEPLNITLVGSPDVYEFSNINYKQATEYKSYSITSEDGFAYPVFEIRKVSDNSIVAVSYASIKIGRNYSLVISGLLNGTPSLSTSLINLTDLF